MPTYNKLVRDKIPEIIEKNGEKCSYKRLDKELYIKELRKKLIEEVNEYLEADGVEEAIEELADVLEIMQSLSKIHGKSLKDIEDARQKKFRERGGFDGMLYLMDVD